MAYLPSEVGAVNPECTVRWMMPALLVAWSDAALAGERARDAALDALSAHTPEALDEPAIVEQLSRGLSGQLAVAAAQHPGVRGDFERWHAAALAVAPAGALPDPTVEMSVFLQAIETRTGPQQGRIGLRQGVPWPGVLVAGSEAALEASRAAEARFDARLLDVALAVEDAHWNLWSVRTMRSIHEDHHALVEGLSGTVRGRVEVGSATLSELQQIDLEHARMMDDIARMDEQERSAEAALRAAIGVWTDDPISTGEAPGGPHLPSEAVVLLEAAAMAHPLLQEARHRVAVAEAGVRVAQGQRRPGFSVGMDWIPVAPAASAGTGEVESGQDALAVGVGVSVPIWQKRAADRVAAARAQARGARADAELQEVSARAALHDALARVESSGRRVETIRGTLLPQAEAAYASLLGTYTAGTSSVAQLLLSQQALLELRLDLIGAQVTHARAWALLRSVCGRDVQARHLVSPPVE